ncbi:ubiquitin-like domain-containing protein [Clostridium sp. MB40-C1]|uniref:ubiquitin-like domain-containing protein n=1 Tax=Clostridium sp. MB40-C1 TaxID=3070996 RepID=UPI0027E14755|nr:ubiquitin-like domain-containing protein [Clostridium sp. MB40-C1]WMJ79836.1 ubiquitin-like domain-containing protein [Clostridium sp. MB40-C1]
MLQKITSDIKTYFSNGPKILFLFGLVLICTLIGMFTMQKSVNIVVDGKEISVMTYKNDVKDVLEKNNIALGPKDIVEPDLKSKIKSGDTIKIERAINIQLQVDGKSKNVATTADNVKEMLSQEGIKFSQEDKISPSKEETIREGLKVNIVRVNSKIEKKVEPLEFTTVVKKDSNLKEGYKKVVQDGTAGQKEIQYKVIYEDGKEVSRQMVNQTVIQQPKDKIVAMGTMQTVRLSRGDSSYLRKIRMRATAYTSSFKDTGKRPGDRGFGVTASGTRTKRTSGGYSTVAVDPSIIPLGTKLYIEGYGYAIAEDTGGAIKGNRIDLYFNSDSEVHNFGVRYLNVYIVQ